MRFVSKHGNFTFVARPDTVQMILGPGGAMMPHTVESAIICDFTHGMVRPDEAVMAAEKWMGMGSRTDGTPIAFGAIPSGQSGVVNGVAHDSWQPMLTFSVFDTESIPNEADRAYAEKRLLEDASNGNHYIQVGHRKLDPPWPTYEQMQGKKGQPTSALICNMIREGGYDPDYVIAYELQRERPRYDIPKAIEALKEELAAQAVEDASLAREIPA
jgi:hypothetical protein